MLPWTIFIEASVIKSQKSELVSTNFWTIIATFYVGMYSFMRISEYMASVVQNGKHALVVVISTPPEHEILGSNLTWE
jgi:hypothetical protein